MQLTDPSSSPQGTSYTILNTERLTNRTTATNYAGDFATLVPVSSSSPRGPFVHQPTWDRPEHYILTKTHCGGYCEQCTPKQFVLSYEQFEKSCRTGHSVVNGVKKTNVVYRPGLVRKAIHLIRDPFDNLVARMHLSVKHQKVQGLDQHHSREGFLAWCELVDAPSVNTSFHRDVLQLMQDVPCASDWFRYVQWHNHAAALIQREKLDSMVVYYESYSTQYEETVQSILDFVEQPAVQSPLHFQKGKTYHNLYTPEEAASALRLAKRLATPECWELIRHYFDGWGSS